MNPFPEPIMDLNNNNISWHLALGLTSQGQATAYNTPDKAIHVIKAAQDADLLTNSTVNNCIP